MNDSKFSEDLPIKVLMKTYLGIDIKGKSLDTIFNEMASMIDEERSNLRPTTGPLAYQRMKIKFDYLIKELCDSYGIRDNEVKDKRKYFWDLVDDLEAKDEY